MGENDKTELNALQGVPGNPAPRTRKGGHPWGGKQGLSHHTGQIQLGDSKHGVLFAVRMGAGGR